MAAILRGRRLWAFALLLAPITASAGTDEVEHYCTVTYPSIMQYFAWKDCVKVETAKEAEQELRRQEQEREAQRLEAALPCLAKDLPRMETLATAAKSMIHANTSLESAQAALAELTSADGTIVIPKDNIRDRVLVTSINTKCDSTFHFLINVREGADKKLRWFRVGAENAPPGYQNGPHYEFGNEFEDEREQQRRNMQAARSQEEFKAQMAKQEREIEEQRQKFLQGVKITNAKMKCLGTPCSMRTLEFTVTNVSQEPVVIFHSVGCFWRHRRPNVHRYSLRRTPPTPWCSSRVRRHRTAFLYLKLPKTRTRNTASG
jgi:hypothetical protein